MTSALDPIWVRIVDGPIDLVQLELVALPEFRYDEAFLTKDEAIERAHRSGWKVEGKDD